LFNWFSSVLKSCLSVGAAFFLQTISEMTMHKPFLNTFEVNLNAMKPFFLPVGCLFLMFSFSTSCTPDKSTQTEEYIIKVDSIQVTDNVRVGDKIMVRFFGIIGNNGCSSFKRYIVQSRGKMHTITVIGKRSVGENLVCTENLPLLNGMTLALPTDSIGSNTVEIINPGIHNLITQHTTVIP